MDHRLLQPAALTTTAGFKALQDQFESKIDNPDISFDALVEQLLVYPGLLPRLIASLTINGSNRFWTRAKAHIPEEPSLNGFTDSILQRLLSFFDAYFSNLNIGVGELSVALTNCSTSIGRTLPILAQLEAHCIVPGQQGTSASHQNDFIAPALESALFSGAGFTTPSSRREATKLSARLIRSAKTTLKGYLDILRDRRTLDPVEKYHLSSLVSTSDNDDALQESDDGTEKYDFVQTFSHKKAAVVMDVVDDHGPCKLNVSTRFIENMRTSKSRPRLFAKIKTVLRELSHGLFSAQNKILLTSSEEPVAIYYAYLSKYCAIVYYLPNTNIQQPEFCVFGIYTPSHLEDVSFWNSVADQIATKELHQPHQQSGNLSVEPEIADRIRSLVMLTQFVEYSKPILQRIQDDEEIQVIYAMSPQEQEVIDHDGSCYILGRSGTGKTTIMLFKMIGIEASWLHFGGEGGMKPRQLFITRSQHLADKVKEAFARLHETHVSGYTPAFGSADDHMWNATTALPGKFSALKSGHFPLFISFETLCSMLEADLALETYTSADSHASRGLRNRRLLTYEMFLGQYWNDFPDHVVRGQDPFLVYGEIIGVIQGSEEALASGQQFLDRTTYVCRGGRSLNTGTEMRERMYDIFECYRIRRTELGHCDIAQRTHRILQAFHNQRPDFLKTVDFLYVDEAQDNLLTDIVVLRTLCKNSNGLILAGDTARTIFAGNAFTFNTLRSFLYRLESKESSFSRSKRAPEFFKLLTNFRSRGGIVACGQTVLDLVVQFWPAAIDYIPKEVDLICGTRPYFFNNDNGVDLRQLISTSNKSIEFGAEQCILVRDEVARDDLKARLGDSTIILTLYESKGLEFNDVLLFNFFQDSTCSAAQWKTLLSAADNAIQQSPPDALLTELRFIYVAITRARNRLWVIDQSDSGQPLQTLLQRKGEIETTDNLDIGQFATASEADVWARRGREFLAERRYLLASQALRMARLFHEADVARAFYLQEQVDVVHPHIRPQALREAGEAFENVAEEAETYDRRVQYFSTSADCFSEIPDVSKAASCYVKGEAFTKATVMYRQAAMFHEAMSTVRQYAGRLEDLVVRKIVYASKLFFFRQLCIEDGISLCGSELDAISFTEAHGLKRAQAAVLRHQSRHADSAKLYLQINQPSKTLELCRGGVLELPIEVLIETLWRESKITLLHAKMSDQSPGTLQDLVRLADLYAQQSTGFGEECTTLYLELHLLKSIANGDSQGLRSIRSEIADRRSLDHVLVTVLFHYSLLEPTVMTADKKPLADIIDRIDALYRYTRALRALALQDGMLLCQNNRIQHLFGFVPISPRSYRLRRKGHAASFLIRRNDGSTNSEGSSTVTASVLAEALTRHFTKLLQDTVGKTMHKHANLRPDTVVPTSGSQTRIMLQILLHLVLVQDTLRCVGLYTLRDDTKISWLERFYAFFIQSDTQFLATLAMTIRKIPDSGLALQVLRDWTSDTLQLIPKIAVNTRLSLFLKLAFLGSLLGLKDTAHHLTAGRALGTTAPLTWLLIHPRLAPLRHQRAHYVANDFLDAVEAKQPWALHSAIQFLSRVLDQRLPVDIWVLCDYIDYIVSGLSITLGGACVNVVIPRSTSLLVLQNLSGFRTQEMYILDRFLRIVREMLWKMLLPEAESSLLVNEQCLRKESQERIEAIIRVCQSLGILGFNVEDPLLRQKLVDVIAVLRRPDAEGAVRADHKLYTRFSVAEKWAQLVEASRSSASVARIVLKAQRNGTEQFHLSYTRWYNSTGRTKKDGEDLKQVPKAELGTNGEETPKVESVTNDTEALEEAEPTNDIKEIPKVEAAMKLEFRLLCAILDDSPFQMHSPTDSILVGRLAEAMATQLPGVNELVAAKKIQLFVRRALRRSRPVSISEVSHAVRRRFEECLDYRPQLPLLSRQERLLFLGPLPHVLACLDGLSTYFNFRKDKLAVRLQKVGHIDLEEAGADVARAHELVVKVNNLQSTLRPEASLYLASGWLHAFKDYVEQVGELIRKIEDVDIRQEFDTTWALVFRSVLYTGRRSTFVR